jgi:hypothetical protein
LGLWLGGLFKIRWMLVMARPLILLDACGALACCGDLAHVVIACVGLYAAAVSCGMPELSRRGAGQKVLAGWEHRPLAAAIMPADCGDRRMQDAGAVGSGCGVGRAGGSRAVA